MVARALLLVLVMTLAALPAWAGIVPSTGGLFLATFVQDSLPDANFSGFADASICSLAAGARDTSNWGGDLIRIGCLTTPSNRRQKALLRLVPGAYLPSDASIDSSKLLLSHNATGVVDSAFAAIVLKPWLEGAGTGAATDSTDVCWKFVARNALGDATQRDTTWTKAGADSVMALRTRAAGSHWDLAYAGALNYLTVNLNTKEDRGPYQFIGKVTAGGPGVFDTLNVTQQVRFIFNSPYAAANNGILIKVGYSDSTVTAHSNTFNSKESATKSLRPRWLIWYHRTSGPVMIGGGE